MSKKMMWNDIPADMQFVLLVLLFVVPFLTLMGSITLLEEWWLGPIETLFASLYARWLARHRVRSRTVALLKQRELDEWQRFKERQYGLLDFYIWTHLPSFVCDWLHPKRSEFTQGYQLAVAALDEQLDTAFAKEIEEEFIRLVQMHPSPAVEKGNGDQ